MLKKLLTGCLTIAMIGAFSASAAADTTFTWTGNVTANFIQKSHTDATSDAESLSYNDMYASADLDLSVKTAGDVWSSEAKIELDIDYGGSDQVKEFKESDYQHISVDDLYVVASKEGLSITFGEFDPFGIGKGDTYVADIDDTYGAGGIGSVFDEKGLVMVSLTDVGLNLIVGMNKVGDVSDTTKDVASETTFGAQFSKTFGDLALAVAYYGQSRSVNDKDADATTDYINDGFSASELALAVQYTMGDMAFTLNYTSQSNKDGREVKNNNSYIELLFDMGIGDDMGLTVGYDLVAEKQDDGTNTVKTTKNQLIASLMFKLGPVENYITYESSTNKTDEDNSETGSDSMVGYMMKVPF